MLLRNKRDILQRWMGFLLNTKCITLHPQAIESVAQRETTLATDRMMGAAPTFEETERALRGLHNWKAAGHDFIVAELLKIDGDGEPIALEHFHAGLVDVWNGGEVPPE